MNAEYEKAAKELAKLPRAERYQSLLTFPNRFAFKAIGNGAAFGQEIRELLDNLGHHDVIVIERPSKKGKYLSITFTLEVSSGQEIDDMLKKIEALKELKLVL